ncbi:FAD-dependent oxidoreductase [Candidatus Woesearchaeota archaeon]|nr:FAD-dependent oxidoreductase [Candidatus Woesearchaeota archaeon]
MSNTQKTAVVLGAGITGMTVAWKLSEAGYKVHVIEKTDKVGGMAGSFSYKDMVLDYGPHKVYTQLPGILDVYKEIVGEDLLRIKKKNSLRLLGRYFDFPVKIFQVMLGLGIGTALKCGLGYGFTLLKSFFSKKKLISYEDYFLAGFGKPAYNLLFRDYAWKVWGDPKSLSEELARKRIPVPNIFELVKGTLGIKPKTEVSAEYFYYPKKGIGNISEILAERLLKNHGEIHFHTVPEQIYVENGKVTHLVVSDIEKKSQKTLKTDIVVSTIYVTELPALLQPAAPQTVLDAAMRLHFRAMIIVYVVVKKPKLMEDNWLFFPEQTFIFNRIAEHKSFSNELVPADKTVLTAEVTCTPDDEIWKMPEKELYAQVVQDLTKAGILNPSDIEECFSKRMKKVYPIYAIGFKDHLMTILDHLQGVSNLLTLGRQGLFNYNNTDHCIDMALKAAEHIIGHHSPEEWMEKIRYFDAYKIVD